MPERNLTWVTVADAARYAQVSRSAVGRMVSAGDLEVRLVGRTRTVPLETVLAKTVPADLVRLRGRIARAALVESGPPAFHEWAASMVQIVVPLLDRLEAAEARAALAEAKLESITAGAGEGRGTANRR
ncbi:MAG TPA: helix-turn-helix domain-containing protein [Acidimicrobiales bacterium]|nr:helix-turn-helix domain-containing protein [Acidimicrobiales bacterium]